jgi:murein DD-endopeptidase MepM/ murein hydrolase activator NlpD
VLPLAQFRLTARFGASGRAWTHRHTGLDFAAPYGSRVRSIAAGRITFAGWDGAYGNRVAVRHLDGAVTWYAHLSQISQHAGRVRAGHVIGYVGSSGNATGPHLHFEVRPHGAGPVDPEEWLRRHGLRL